MAYRELELTLLSARDLKNVNLFTRMEVYAVVTISGDQLTRQCTAPDPYGGRNPTWNAALRFAVPPTAAAAAGACLHVLLRAERALGDRDVGEVIVPLADLLATAPDPGPRPPQLASYQVRKLHRSEPRGVLNVSYRLGPVVAPVEQPERAGRPPVVAPVHQPERAGKPPVVTYPATPPPQQQPFHAPPGPAAYPPSRPHAAGHVAEHQEAPPARNGKGNGHGPAVPTHFYVGPHTQIIYGGGAGGPNRPATMASPARSNVGAGKADRPWPKPSMELLDTHGGGGGFAVETTNQRPVATPRQPAASPAAPSPHPPASASSSRSSSSASSPSDYSSTAVSRPRVTGPPPAPQLPASPRPSPPTTAALSSPTVAPHQHQQPSTRGSWADPPRSPPPSAAQLPVSRQPSFSTQAGRSGHAIASPAIYERI
ncbi:hypothetical protein ACP70R_012007 [Stipagrostis hirtigluma subsp. patula]